MVNNNDTSGSNSTASERTPFLRSNNVNEKDIAESSFDNDGVDVGASPTPGMLSKRIMPSAAEGVDHCRTKLTMFALASILVLLFGWTVTFLDNTTNRIIKSSSSSIMSSNNNIEIVNDDIHENVELTFDEWREKFGRLYSKGSDEYEKRKVIFDSNLQRIREHNSNKETHGWTMGLNQFADRLKDEIPFGFDKSLPHGPNAHEHFAGDPNHHPFSSVMEKINLRSSDDGGGRQGRGQNHRKLRTRDLPDHVDWRNHDPPVVTPVKDQGGCGGCWAFAAATVLESHTALYVKGNPLFQLSPQELISCSPNPDHCGGNGGCQGATCETAYDYVSKHGMVTEWVYGYSSYNGDTGICALDEMFDGYLRSTKVSVAGYSSLPTNSYDALMYAVATIGPVTVSIAANNWIYYKSGVFDDFNMTDDYDINHAVVVEGYGTDEETGQDYWLVRNSWGVLWGEEGYIRLKREDPRISTIPVSISLDDADNGDDDGDNSYEMNMLRSKAKQYCKMDITPADGVSCTGLYGNETVPDQLVCGTSGILYANVIPIGAHLVSMY